jgi:hypothetical protein
MRSRDGNYTFSFSISVALLLLLSSLALNASEYLISYRYLVKDATLYNETLFISKAMQKCEGTPYYPLILKTRADKNLKKIIATQNEKFIEYIHKLGLNVDHKDITTNFQYSSVTILTLKTTCFKVDFNDNFVKISPLK